MCTWQLEKNITLTKQTFVGKVMSLLFDTLSRFVIAFLSRSKCLIISLLQSPSAVILEAKKMKSFTASTFPPYICHEIMSQLGPWQILFSFFFFTLVLPLLDCHMHVCMLSCFSHVWLFAALWTLAHQALLSVVFPRQECWSDFECHLQWHGGDFPDPGIEPASPVAPAWQDSLPLSHWGS